MQSPSALPCCASLSAPMLQQSLPTWIAVPGSSTYPFRHFWWWPLSVIVFYWKWIRFGALRTIGLGLCAWVAVIDLMRRPSVMNELHCWDAVRCVNPPLWRHTIHLACALRDLSSSLVYFSDCCQYLPWCPGMGLAPIVGGGPLEHLHYHRFWGHQSLDTEPILTVTMLTQMIKCYDMDKHYWEALESFAVRLVELRLVVTPFFPFIWPCCIACGLWIRFNSFECVILCRHRGLSSWCLGGCLVGVFCWALAPFLVGLFSFGVFCFFGVGRYAYLTGGCAFLHYAWFDCVFVCHLSFMYSCHRGFCFFCNF